MILYTNSVDMLLECAGTALSIRMMMMLCDRELNRAIFGGPIPLRYRRARCSRSMAAGGASCSKDPA